MRLLAVFFYFCLRFERRAVFDETGHLMSNDVLREPGESVYSGTYINGMGIIAYYEESMFVIDRWGNGLEIGDGGYGAIAGGFLIEW